MVYIKIYESFLSDRIELSNKQKELDEKFNNLIADTIPEIYTSCNVNIRYVDKEYIKNNNKWVDIEPHFLLKTDMSISKEGLKYFKDDSITDTLTKELILMNNILNDYKIDYILDYRPTLDYTQLPNDIKQSAEKSVITDFNKIIERMKNVKNTNSRMSSFYVLRNLSIKFYKN